MAVTGNWEGLSGKRGWIHQRIFVWADGWTRPRCSGRRDTYVWKMIDEYFLIDDKRTQFPGEGRGAKVTPASRPDQSGVWKSTGRTLGGDLRAIAYLPSGPAGDCDLCRFRYGFVSMWRECDVRWRGVVGGDVTYIQGYVVQACGGCLCLTLGVRPSVRYGPAPAGGERFIATFHPARFVMSADPWRFGPSQWGEWSICPCSGSKPRSKTPPPTEPRPDDPKPPSAPGRDATPRRGAITPSSDPAPVFRHFEGWRADNGYGQYEEPNQPGMRPFPRNPNPTAGGNEPERDTEFKPGGGVAPVLPMAPEFGPPHPLEPVGVVAASPEAGSPLRAYRLPPFVEFLHAESGSGRGSSGAASGAAVAGRPFPGVVADAAEQPTDPGSSRAPGRQAP